MLQRSNRYEIYRPLEFRYRDSGGPVFGTGKSLNISRRGLLFETDEPPEVGKRIEVVVHMGPAAGSGPEVNLHIQGVTVRSEEGRAAVIIKRYKLKSLRGLSQKAG